MQKTDVSQNQVEISKIVPHRTKAVLAVFKIITLSALSLGIVFGNFFLEAYVASGKSIEKNGIFDGFDYQNETIIPEHGIIRFDLVYNKDPSVDSVFVGNNNEYVFDFQRGKAWMNLFKNSAKVNFIIGGKIVLIPRNAIFDIAYDGEKISLNVFNGDLYIGVLRDGAQITKYVDEYNDSFMNSLVVSKNTKADISLRSVNEKISQLLYTKLTKEFKNFLISDDYKNAEWAKTNTFKDKDYFENMKRDESSKLSYYGDKVSDGMLRDMFISIKSSLTFIPDKKIMNDFTLFFDYLDSALYFSNNRNETKALALLDEADAKYPFSPESESYNDRLDLYIKDLTFFTPEDNQYKVLLYILNKRGLSKDVEKVINKLWLDLYESLDLSRFKALTAMDIYLGYYNDYIKDSANLNQKYFIYQNQLFENLFINYPYFYKESYFLIKNELENSLLSFYDEGQLRDELAQDLASIKISFIKRLTKFFFDDEIAVEDARIILKQLVKEIYAVMPSSTEKLAVEKLFTENLKDIGDFWGYLNTTEYNSSKIYGATHKDRYKVYLEEKDKIWSFVDITNEALEGQAAQQLAPKQTVSDVKDEISNLFAKNDKIENLQIGDITDVNQRYVDFKLSVSGYPVTASFDRDYEAMINVYVYNELVSDRLIKIDGLIKIIEEKFTALTEPELNKLQQETEAENLTNETNAQRIARIYLTKKISDEGFILTDRDLLLVDSAKTIYRAENIYLKGYDKVKVSFDYKAAREVCTNIFFMMEEMPISVTGEYTLKELAAMIAAGVDTLKKDEEGTVGRDTEEVKKPVSR